MKKDSHFVDKNDMNELRYWSKKFGITVAELLILIADKGNKVSVLKAHFKK